MNAILKNIIAIFKYIIKNLRKLNIDKNKINLTFIIMI